MTSSLLCILSSTLTQLYVPMVIPKDLVITAKPSPSLISIFGIQDLNYTSCLISSLLLVPQSQQCSSLVGTCKASIPLLMTPSCRLSLPSLNSKFKSFQPYECLLVYTLSSLGFLSFCYSFYKILLKSNSPW